MLNHYPPAPALDPYIRRHYVFRAEMPADADVQDKMIAETAFIRIPLRGEWYIEGEAGDWIPACGAKLFGPNSRGFPLRVVGPFLILGCGIKPSGWKSLFDCSAHLHTDRMTALEDLWGDIATDMMRELDADQSDETMVAAMDRAIARQVDKIGLRQTDSQIEQFETIGRIDSTVRIDDAARELGLSVRQLERRSLESLGMTPKTFLRRCRFLDMAMTMRGFSHPSDEDLAELRYFDQSHLNREFKRFVGMTPKTFRNAYTPLMTEGLKLRKEGDEKIFNQPRF
ncbi:MAG: AraC family transcriptional regulator [Pseudomonadota bacterium]